MSISPDKTFIRSALIGGGIAAAVIIGLEVFIGVASGATSRELMMAAMPTIRFLASAVATSAATTLALILTLLGLSANTDLSLEGNFYRQLRRVARLDVATFIGAVALLIVLIVPLGTESKMSDAFHTGAYYFLSGGAAIVAGLLVSVVLSLYGAVHDLIETCWLDDDPLVPEEEKEADAPESSASGARG